MIGRILLLYGALLLVFVGCQDFEKGIHKRIFGETQAVVLALEEYYAIKGEYPSGDWLEAVESLIAWTTLRIDPYSFSPEEPMRYARVQAREHAGRYTYDISVDRPGTLFRKKKTFRISNSSWRALPRQDLWFEPVDISLLETNKCSFDQERPVVLCGTSLGASGAAVDAETFVEIYSMLSAVGDNGAPVELSRDHQRIKLKQTRTSAIEIELDASTATASSRLFVVGNATIKGSRYRETSYANNVFASWIDDARRSGLAAAM